MLSAPDDYFDRECTSHTAQGDLYAEVPFVWRTAVAPADEPPAGKRPRPADARAVLAVVTAMYESAATGTEVAVPR